MSFSTDIFAYRDYMLGSRGEFTVAKDQNVRLRSSWFSDRSACYLAAGRPVITQDTGFGKFIPAGEGVFSFTTMENIVAALDAINSDYEKHSRAARAIAEEYFRAETVLAKLLNNLDCEDGDQKTPHAEGRRF
jgi:glycosyltransferase involved in cell wall biosynthesis